MSTQLRILLKCFHAAYFGVFLRFALMCVGGCASAFVLFVKHAGMWQVYVAMVMHRHLIVFTPCIMHQCHNERTEPFKGQAQDEKDCEDLYSQEEHVHDLTHALHVHRVQRLQRVHDEHEAVGHADGLEVRDGGHAQPGARPHDEGEYVAHQAHHIDHLPKRKWTFAVIFHPR